MRGTDWTPDGLRSFVDKIAEHHDAGRLPFALHLPGGNEEQLIDIFSGINEGDYVLSTHRNMYHALLHGLPPEEVEQKILSGRSMFMFDRERNFYVSAIIGGPVAIAVGIAWALKRKGSSQRVYCFLGDGTEDTGHFAEAVRYVDGFDLPCTFIIEDDRMAVEAPKERRWGTDKDLQWPACVKRYHYTKTRPHIRTGNFADLKVMKETMKTDEEYFPLLPKREYPNTGVIPPLDIKFKDAVTQGMTELGDEGAIFIGYSLLPGDAMGTLKNVPDDQKIETPVAENLMVGLAIGMSFEGFKPVVYFERHDFMLVAADAIGNHIDKIERISHGEFKVPVVLKTVVDDGGLFYSGPTHSQNFTKVFREMVDFPVLDPQTPEEALDMYRYAKDSDGPVMIVEHKRFH
jgi:hypothetical protein